MKGTLKNLFGDFGHTVRTLIIGSVAAAAATWGWNTIKKPVENLQDAGKIRQELTELKAEVSNRAAKEREWRDKRNGEIDVRFGKLEADTVQLKVDTSFLKGKIR